jgi:hypothetical protein
MKRKDTNHEITAYILNDGCAPVTPGVPGDRGCVRCGEIAKAGDGLVYDARGRYWHARCAGRFLSAIERKGEARLGVGPCELLGRNIAGGYRVAPRPGTERHARKWDVPFRKETK